MAEEPSTDPVLEALWARVVDAWEDDAVHAAVLEHAVRAQRLPDLASRYRALTGEGPRAEKARKRLDAIVVAATTLLFSMQTPPRAKVPIAITLSAFGICAFLLLLLAWAMWGKR